MSLCYNKLRKLLKEKNITKTKLCEDTGISRSTLAKMKNGKNINSEIFNRICKVLDCDVGDIVEYGKD